MYLFFEEEKMLSNYYENDVPEYYSTMWIDGYSPEQILMAQRKSMYEDYYGQNVYSQMMSSQIDAIKKQIMIGGKRK